MKASEFIFEKDEELYDTKMAWGRVRPTPKGGKTKLKFRCTSGPRKSRLVSDPSACFGHPDVAQSQRMKRTRARTKNRQARLTKRAKKINIATRIISKLNKFLK
jgi:hypothetical protein